MNICGLTNKDINIVIDLYFKHKKEFYDLITIEDFYEQFCNKCLTCGRIICVLDMCEECDNKKEENEFQEFELDKEHYIYNLY